MPLFFWRGQGPTSLTPKVREAVIDRFRLTENAADELKMIQKRGKFAGRSVTHVRVFDHSKVAGVIARYAHLDDAKGAIRFYGRIEKGGYLYIDRVANA